MSIPVIINGAHGKMGRLAQSALASCDTVEVAALTGRGDDLGGVIRETKAAAVLDFTRASSVLKNAETIIERRARPIIGTSGLSAADCSALAERCAKRKIGGLVVPNFSITATLMMKYARDAAKYLKNVEVVEYHHDKKEEAPSGTGVRTAELIAESHIEPRPRGREIAPGSLGGEVKGVPIHSIRMPGYIARQEVLFGDVGELLALRSEATSRDCFAQGIRLACQRIMELDTLKVGLETIL